MPPDATHTKQRILAAARAEFAAYGLAGARVDRIAAAAEANKRSIYVHFGPKEQLFDLIVSQGLMELADVTPFDATAIPQYAGALFDMLFERPEIIRLTSWALLERPQPIDLEVAAYRTKVKAIVAAQERGHLSSAHDPIELLAMVLALATSWSQASWSLRSLQPEADGSQPSGRFRTDMISAVRAMVIGPQ